MAKKNHMYTLFISDLHLDPSRPKLTEIFLTLLKTHADKADALYILGDFFEVWLGDDDDTSLIRSITHALATLTSQGVPVYFLHGNRDFLLGQRFLKAAGCQLLPDPAIIDLYGRPTLLLHGDTLCTDDVDYLRFRRVARNPLYQRIFLSLPLFIRRAIARYLRSKSSQQTSDAYLKLSDATDAAIQQVMQEHHIDLLIHGHTHRPSIQLNLRPPSWQRVVLSDWEEQGNVLICYPDNTQRLLYLS